MSWLSPQSGESRSGQARNQLSATICIDSPGSRSGAMEQGNPLMNDNITPMSTTVNSLATTSPEAGNQWEKQMQFADQRHTHLNHLQWSLVREQMGAHAHEIGVLQSEVHAVRLELSQQTVQQGDNSRRIREMHAQLQQEISAEAQQRRDLGTQMELAVTSIADETKAASRGLQSEAADRRDSQERAARNLTLVEERLSMGLQELRRQMDALSNEVEAMRRDRAEADERTRATLVDLNAALEEEKNQRSSINSWADREMRALRLASDDEAMKRSSADEQIMADVRQLSSMFEATTNTEVSLRQAIQDLHTQVCQEEKARMQSAAHHEKTLETMVAVFRGGIEDEAAARRGESAAEARRLDKALEAVDQKLTERIYAITPEFQEIISSLKDQHSKAIVELNTFKMEVADKLHVSVATQETMETKLQRDILDLKATHNHEITSVRERLKADLTDKQSTQESMATRLDSIEQKMREGLKHMENVSDAHQSAINQVLDSRERSLQEKLVGLDTEHYGRHADLKEQITKLHSELTDQMSKVYSDSGGQLSELRSRLAQLSHEQYMGGLEMKDAMVKANDREKNISEDITKRLRDDLTSSIEQLNNHRDELFTSVEQLRSSHQTHAEEMSENLKAHQTVHSGLGDRLVRLKQELMSELTDVATKHEGTLDHHTVIKEELAEMQRTHHGNHSALMDQVADERALREEIRSNLIQSMASLEARLRIELVDAKTSSDQNHESLHNQVNQNHEALHNQVNQLHLQTTAKVNAIKDHLQAVSDSYQDHRSSVGDSMKTLEEKIREQILDQMAEMSTKHDVKHAEHRDVLTACLAALDEKFTSEITDHRTGIEQRQDAVNRALGDHKAHGDDVVERMNILENMVQRSDIVERMNMLESMVNEKIEQVQAAHSDGQKGMQELIVAACAQELAHIQRLIATEQEIRSSQHEAMMEQLQKEEAAREMQQDRLRSYLTQEKIARDAEHSNLVMRISDANETQARIGAVSAAASISMRRATVPAPIVQQQQQPTGPDPQSFTSMPSNRASDKTGTLSETSGSEQHQSSIFWAEQPSTPMTTPAASTTPPRQLGAPLARASSPTRSSMPSVSYAPPGGGSTPMVPSVQASPVPGRASLPHAAAVGTMPPRSLSPMPSRVSLVRSGGSTSVTSLPSSAENVFMPRGSVVQRAGTPLMVQQGKQPSASP
mmetsp:Transcript_47684/g.82894  ORF Transcript_47684/g.82894 Transcript_47684/m.82894 type:complete len:1189 (-) Transcript_47684:108-3674(-)